MLKDKNVDDNIIFKLDENIKMKVEDILTTESYKKYMKTMSNFHNYSFGNCCLIFSQKPGASFVAGFNSWKKQGRFVKKGEKSIRITAPSPIKKIEEINGKKEEVVIPLFKAVNVFDISQTDGEPVKNTSILPSLEGEVENFDKIIDVLKKTTNCKVSFVNSTSENPMAINRDQTKGWYDKKLKEIVVLDTLPPKQQIKTLIHEIAHEYSDLTNKTNGTKAEKELEAESVAYIICDKLGIDTSDYSFGYLQSYKNLAEKTGSKGIKELLNDIKNTSKKIIDKIEDVSEKEIKKEKNKDMTI